MGQLITKRKLKRFHSSTLLWKRLKNAKKTHIIPLRQTHTQPAIQCWTRTTMYRRTKSKEENLIELALHNRLLHGLRTFAEQQKYNFENGNDFELIEKMLRPWMMSQNHNNAPTYEFDL